jgi:putative membrane protein
MLLDSLSNFLIYFGFSITLIAVFTWLYVKVTPYNEFKLILEEGNEAAAIALVGAMIGFALPIASVIYHSVSVIDFMMWAVIAAVVQLSIAALITRGFGSFEQLMVKGLKAAGILLAGVHLVAGMINAASMSY